jgi:hypothetical protein
MQSEQRALRLMLIEDLINHIKPANWMRSSSSVLNDENYVANHCVLK